MSPVVVSMRWCVSCVRMTHGFHEVALITDLQAYTLTADGVHHASGYKVARPSPTFAPHLRSQSRAAFRSIRPSRRSP